MLFYDPLPLYVCDALVDSLAQATPGLADYYPELARQLAAAATPLMQSVTRMRFASGKRREALRQRACTHAEQVLALVLFMDMYRDGLVDRARHLVFRRVGPEVNHLTSKAHRRGSQLNHRLRRPIDGALNSNHRLPRPVDGALNSTIRLRRPGDGARNSNHRLPRPVDGARNSNHRLPRPGDGARNSNHRLPRPVDGARRSTVLARAISERPHLAVETRGRRGCAGPMHPKAALPQRSARYAVVA
jgi:hypothetical protein